jgi:ribosomal protein S1
MHDAGALPARPEADRLQVGALVAGSVVCHHVFGMGVHLAGRDEYGHVDIIDISRKPLRGPEDFPAIGSTVRARVLGYSGGQLRLTLLDVPAFELR